MMSMGYSRKEIEESLFQQKYNDIMATYLLLARRGSDVSYIISCSADKTVDISLSLSRCSQAVVMVLRQS